MKSHSIVIVQVILNRNFIANTLYILFYYIDTSVLLENIPLIKFIKTTSETREFIFHNLTREFIDDVISVISLYYIVGLFVFIIKRTLHGGLKI